MAFTIVRSVATKMTSSLTGAPGSPASPEGNPAAQPDSAAAVRTDPSRRIICRVMIRVYAAEDTAALRDYSITSARPLLGREEWSAQRAVLTAAINRRRVLVLCCCAA